MDPSADIRELWGLVDAAPERVPFVEGDRDGYHLDLLVRAGKRVRTLPEVVEAVEYLTHCPASSGPSS